ncbi:putative transaldolase [Xylaria cf. heliscus]|nr:putative transaldolase [Xylaria cf. heliscus]
MSEKNQTLLDLLRTLSAVDCDTLDVGVAKQLGPFVDCTSNQAIVHNELSKTDAEGKLINGQLITDSIAYSNSKTSKFPNININEVVVEAISVKLAHRIAPYRMGYSHLQTNPKYSFDTQKTVANARRFVAISHDLDPNFDTRKLCIKIPATWEGVQACKELESEGITTLATAISSMPQAILASHAGCTYNGCYINELRVHFDESYVDENKAFYICDLSQRFYKKQGKRTQVIAASLISIDEIMMLAGADHITVAPSLLYELSKTPAGSWKGAIGSVFKTKYSEAQDTHNDNIEDEKAWRLAFSRDQDGKSEARLNDAIKLFSEKQDALEDIVRLHI